MNVYVSRSLPFLALAIVFTTRAQAPSEGEVLTNASQVLALPAERALQGVRISVKGVITAAEKYWDGRFFVQDASGGVFADNVGGAQPEVGDLVEVTGISHPGAFAPVISKPSWKKIGTAPLPTARPVPIERLMSGVEDSQRIEISGIIRRADGEHSLLSVDIVSGSFRLHVFARPEPGVPLESLIGARVRIRGTAAASFNAQLRQLITVKIFAPLAEDFGVEQGDRADPFGELALPLGSIAQYRKDNAPDKRVHVTGVVTCQRLGEDLFLQDDHGGLRIKTVERAAFVTGETVEAVGFPSLDHFLPVLEDANCRKAGSARANVSARPSLMEELQAGYHHADLVRLRARLIDRDVRRSVARTSDGMQISTLLTLQEGGMIFTAEAESMTERQDLVSVGLGSMVEITGVCLSEIDEEGGLKLLKLLLPAGHPMRVLEAPGWLTPQRLSVSLAVVFAVLLVTLASVLMFSRNNAQLKVVVREKENAQRQLQSAHDELESRVKERGEQLKHQITARKESELRFKAVLTERTRLAQELHDTLEQTFTGIALQMDTAARLTEEEPKEANYHLGLARSLVGQGQIEARRSVWDLRSRSLEQFELPVILNTSCRQLTDGTAMQAEVITSGGARPLPDLIEDNLLRIAQEALTNAVKHSEGTHARIELDYGASNVLLTVTDNGKGFNTEDCAGPLEGHFGLLGISERVKRINGQVVIKGLPGGGTSIRVEIPLETEVEVELPTFAGLDV
jgi:signal transduction histidine kinase